VSASPTAQGSVGGFLSEYVLIIVINDVLLQINIKGSWLWKQNNIVLYWIWYICTATGVCWCQLAGMVLY
jgi:hypothetical protein